MGETLTLSRLQQLGALPKGIQAINNKLVTRTCLSIKEYENLESDERARLNKNIIADDAEWVAMHKTGTYSLGKDGFIYKTSQSNNAITKYELREDNKLYPIKFITLEKPEITNNNKFEEEQTMEAKTPEQLAAEMQEKINNKGGSVLDPSKSFSEDAEKKALEEEKARKEAEAKAALAEALSRDVSAVKVGNLHNLNNFNYSLGQLYGYIMGGTEKIVTGTKKVRKLEKGQPVLTADAPDDVRKAFAMLQEGQKADVASKYYQTHSVFNFRQAGPSSMLGMIFAMPAGGVIAEDQLRKASEDVPFDATKKELVKFVLAKDEAQTMISTYFGGKIKESAETHENPGILSVNIVLSLDKEGAAVYRTSMKSNRGKFYTKDNWIPRKVNKTISLQDAMALPTKELSDLNRSLFGKLWDTPKDGNAQATFYKLSPEDKVKVSSKDGLFTSEFVKVGGSFPEIKTYYSDEKIPVIELPVKVFVPKKTNAAEETLKPVFYDVLKPDATLEALNPDTNGKFAKMKAILPKDMSIREAVEMVSNKVSVGRKSSAKAQVLTPEEAFSLVQGTIQAPVNGLKSKLDSHKMRSLNDAVASLSYNL